MILISDCLVAVDKTQYFCDICKLYMKSEFSLIRHKKRCHNSVLDPDEGVYPHGFQCNVCQAEMSSHTALIKHKAHWHQNKKAKKVSASSMRVCTNK